MPSVKPPSGIADLVHPNLDIMMTELHAERLRWCPHPLVFVMQIPDFHNSILLASALIKLIYPPCRQIQMPKSPFHPNKNHFP